MRALFLTLLAYFIAIPTSLNAMEDYPELFRGFIWGLTPEIVKEEERSTFIDEDTSAAGTILLYIDKIDGKKHSISYSFVDNKLSKIVIGNEKKYLKDQDRIDDLVKWNNMISETYGEPISEDMKWRPSEDRDKPDRWGWAVYRGELFITTQWRKGDTLVTTYLGATEKYFPKLTLTYEKIAERSAPTVPQAPILSP